VVVAAMTHGVGLTKRFRFAPEIRQGIVSKTYFVEKDIVWIFFRTKKRLFGYRKSESQILPASCWAASRTQLH